MNIHVHSCISIFDFQWYSANVQGFDPSGYNGLNLLLLLFACRFRAFTWRRNSHLHQKIALKQLQNTSKNSENISNQFIKPLSIEIYAQPGVSCAEAMAWRWWKGQIQTRSSRPRTLKSESIRRQIKKGAMYMYNYSLSFECSSEK